MMVDPFCHLHSLAHDLLNKKFSTFSLRNAAGCGPPGSRKFFGGSPIPAAIRSRVLPPTSPAYTDGSNRVVATFTKFLSLRDKTAMALNYMGQLTPVEHVRERNLV